MFIEPEAPKDSSSLQRSETEVGPVPLPETFRSAGARRGGNRHL
jgi:hypothetical protein